MFKIFIIYLVLAFMAHTVNAQGRVWVAEINGAIGPVSADYILRGLEDAAEDKAQLFVIKMDTPGGLDKSMRQMIQGILKSPVPVVTYVHPEGARAASAGTYILYASHIAAMSPATTLGAATPVQIGAPSFPSTPQQPERPQEPSPAGEGATKENGNNSSRQPSSAMERKILNDAIAYIQGLADLRGRNKAWAVLAVRDAASLSADEALKKNVVDLVASNIDDLFDQLHQKEITISGSVVTLDIQGVEKVHHEADWRNQFLSVITDPNVAYILMLLGIYGLIFEFSNPGFAVPGIVGAVCILLALYAFQVLPVSYAALALMLFGLALMVAEAFAPSFGVMGLGGIIAFVIGSIMLMDTEIPAYQLALPVVFAVAALSAGLFIFLLGMVVRARQQAVTMGLSTMIGQHVQVECIRDSGAMVRIDGELWQAASDQQLSIGDWVNIKNCDGVYVEVNKVGDNNDDD